MLKGQRASDETRKRMSASAKLRHRPIPLAARAKIAAAHVGMKASPETIEKLRASHLGKSLRTETIALLRDGRRKGPNHAGWKGGISKDPENKRRINRESGLRYRQTAHGKAILANKSARRRAVKYGNGGSHTLQEWQEKILLHAGCCIYCGEQRPLTRDHNIPLSRGGTDDIGNILPACRACNTRKHTKTAQEFFARKVA